LQPRLHGWRVQMTSGDSYTRDLAAWGAYTQTVDREDDLYCEVGGIQLTGL